MVVDDSRTIHINFRQDVLKLFFTHVLMQILHYLSELLNLDGAAAISVNFVKFSAKIHKFFRVDHLDENVEALAAKPVPSMKVLQTREHILAERLTLYGGFSLINKLVCEPDMSSTLNRSWSILILHCEHLLQQALKLRTHVSHRRVPT